MRRAGARDVRNKQKKQKTREDGKQQPKTSTRLLAWKAKKKHQKKSNKVTRTRNAFFFSMSIFLSSREEKLIKNKTNNNNESECAELSVTPAGPFAREEKESKEQIRGTQRSGAKAHQKHFSLFNPQI